MIAVSMNLSNENRQDCFRCIQKVIQCGSKRQTWYFPLTIDIYVRIVNYFFHLLELAGEGNTVIQSGVAECVTLVNNNQTCWLTSVLYLFKIIGINLKLETGQLHMFGKNDTITAVKNTLRKMFEDKILNEIRNSSKLGLYNCIRKKFATERYLSEISYYKYRSAFAKFRISAHTFPIEKGRWCLKWGGGGSLRDLSKNI